MASAVLSACPLGSHAAAQVVGPAFPQFASAAALNQACDAGLAQAAAGLKQMLAAPADRRWLRRFDAYNAQLEDLSAPISFLSAVHPEQALRDASEACELRWNDFSSSLSQNPTLYRAVRRLKLADPVDRELQRRLVQEFDDAGVGLPAAQRDRAKQLSDRINELGQTFDRHVRDAKVQLAFTEAELAGVPPAVWQAAPRDAEGRRLLGLSYPVYFPAMERAENAATRERFWRAKTDEGGAPNLALLDEIVRLRTDYAQLFGVSSWAEFVIRRRMAQTPQKALAFLDEVKTAVQAREKNDLAELRQAKAEHLGLPLDSVRIERWDTAFYTERLRKARYAVDQEAFRAHFPPQQSLAFALRLVERLMGVRYERIADAAAWHPEVQAYSVKDAASGQALGTLWIDLYPREGKFNHAAVWRLRGASTALKRPSQAALVVNFDRQGLTLEELQTLLHELGHAVHNNLSATRYSQQAGTSVLRDFVEAPSQMLEDWVYDPQALALFAEVCPACQPVPAALLQQAVAARGLGKGLRESRQQLYASYDLALYGPQHQDPLALWAQMEGATPLGHVAGTMFPAGFSHIATGYSAGYYGYLWSLVVATDLRTAFAGHRLDPAVGQRYRRLVLAPGSERPPQQLVHDFLGRDFNAKAFFDELAR